MADVKRCDNCGAIEDEADNLMWWIKVGWYDVGVSEEACSEECARELLVLMTQRRWEIEQQVEADERLEAELEDRRNFESRMP